MKVSKKFIVAQIVILILGGFYVMKRLRENATPLPVLGQVNDFSLVDSNHRTVTLEDFRGKVWVANFIFTSCQGACPLIVQQMQWIQRAYALEGRVLLASFTTDPETDTPEVLGKYAAKYHIKTDRWLFLTGSEKVLGQLSREGLKLAFDTNEPQMHSTRFVLIDQEGRVRGYYEASETRARNALFEDIARLLAEPPLRDRTPLALPIPARSAQVQQPHKNSSVVN